MKIMITGGSGFVGTNLCKQLVNENHEISVLSRNQRFDLFKNKSNFNFYKLDVTNFSDLDQIIKEKKPDVIFHLAGQISHQKSFDDPFYDVEVNAKSTLNLLEIIRNQNFKCRFILGSSFIVTGKPTKLPLTEQSPCEPGTIYGTHRLTSENYCRIYHNLYGLDTIVFRITNSFGPYGEYDDPKKNALNFMISKAFKGETVQIYEKGKFFRDVIFIDDVILALDVLMKKGIAGNLYWISSNKKTWFYEIKQWLEELTNTNVEFIDTPLYTKKVDVGNYEADNTKMRTLGWKPKISVKDGIKITLEYLKSIN